MITSIIFDLDDTLVQTEKLKALSYAQAAKQLQPELDEQDVIGAFKDVVGLSRQEVAAALMERFGLEPICRAHLHEFGVGEPWQVYVRVRTVIYNKILAQPNILIENQYPHNVALLRDMHAQGYKTALATMSHCEQTQRVLDVLSLRGQFNFVAAREDVDRGKPDPEIYLLAARQLESKQEECLVIEDSPNGVNAALAAGMHVIAVTTPYTCEQFRTTDILNRQFVVDDPTLLPDAVKQILGK